MDRTVDTVFQAMRHEWDDKGTVLGRRWLIACVPRPSYALICRTILEFDAVRFAVLEKPDSVSLLLPASAEISINSN